MSLAKHDSFTCDRCAEVFVKDRSIEEYKILSLQEIEDLKNMGDKGDMTTAYIVFKYTNTGLDLCTKCYSELIAWIKTKPKRLSV